MAIRSCEKLHLPVAGPDDARYYKQKQCQIADQHKQCQAADKDISHISPESFPLYHFQDQGGPMFDAQKTERVFPVPHSRKTSEKQVSWANVQLKCITCGKNIRCGLMNPATGSINKIETQQMMLGRPFNDKVVPPKRTQVSVPCQHFEDKTIYFVTRTCSG